MRPQNSNNSAGEDLCLSCGLCCNGVIFADVKLQAADSPARLKLLGMRLTPPAHNLSSAQPGPELFAADLPRFLQPCCALEGCRCRIYSERPQHCRQFECLLLQSVRSGRISKPLALKTVDTARQRTDAVLRLLRQLQDRDEHLPLRTRCRRTARRLEATLCSPEAASLYGQLTLAMHELNLLLSESFYR